MVDPGSGHRNPILHHVLAQARQKEAGRLLAIFDLDSTLFDVQPRISTILAEFAVDPTMHARYPHETDVIAKIESLPEVYHVKEYLMHFGLTKQSPEFYHDVFHFWKARFFSDEYLRHDTPYAGAVEFVQQLDRLGAEILYLTGRDTDRMGAGTRQSLLDWKFPLDDVRTKLALKPHHELDDAEFKRDYLTPYHHGHGPIWFFENELANIELIRAASPHIGIVCFDSIHSGKGAPLPADIPRIRDFLLE